MMQTVGVLVISSPSMDHNGIELLEELRARGITIPIIMLASNSDVPTAVRAMRAGAIDFIDKPFADRVLLNRIRQILASWR